MSKSSILVDRMKCHVAALEKVLEEYQEATGFKAQYYAESGSLYLLDLVRADECELQGSYKRSDNHEDGGAVLADLGGGMSFDGGGG